MKKRLFILIFFSLGFYGCAIIDSNTIRQNYVHAHPNLSEKAKNIILSGKVYPGMTQEEVAASCNDCAYVFKYPQVNTHSVWSSSDVYKCDKIYFNFYNDKLKRFTILDY